MTTGPNYKWVVVALCFLMGALNYADRTAIAAVYPLLRTELNLTNLHLASIGSFFLWAYALASPLAGILGDRVSRSRLLFWSLIGWSAVMAATGFVTNVQQLLLTRVLLGLFEAAYLPAAAALLADHHPTQTRATAIGIHSASLSFGVVAGSTLFGYLGEKVGWRMGFFILGGAGLPLAVLVHFLLKDGPRAAAATAAPKPVTPLFEHLAALVRITSFRFIMLATMTAAVGSWIFINWLPLFFTETYQMGLAGAGFAGTVIIRAASVFGSMSGSVTSDRMARANPQRRLLQQVIFCALAAPPLLVFLLPQPNVIIVYVCIFLFQCLFSFGLCNALPVTFDLLPPALRSTAMGVMNGANCLAGGIGIMLAGMLKSTMGLAGVFAGIAAMSLISSSMVLIAYLFFYKRDVARRDAGPQVPA